MIGKVAAFLRMSWRARALLALAFVVMALAAVAILLMPIRRIAPHLGQSLGAVGLAPLADPVQRQRAAAVRLALARAASIMPLRADCYPQALAGVMLCRWLRLPVAMHLGVRLDASGQPHAHAWTLCGPVAVSGGRGAARYTPVACFLSD